MGELERYGLLALASLTVLFLVLTFVRRDPEPRELASLRSELPASETKALERAPSGRVAASETGAPRAMQVDLAAATENQATRPTTHVVQSGETLGQLAKRYLGASRRWPELVAANGPLDPRALKVGQILRIPADQDWRSLAPEEETPETRPEDERQARKGQKAQDAAPVRPAATQHVVQAGDTLSSISSRYYGDSMQWRRIYQANRDRIPDARRLEVGTILTLP